MKVLIAYHSVSGNTRKVAEAIHKEIRADKDLKPLSDVKDLKGYDLSFIGFPIHASGPAKEAKDFLEHKVTGKDIALFITHSAPEDEPLVRDIVVEGAGMSAAGAVPGLLLSVAVGKLLSTATPTGECRAEHARDRHAEK